MLSDISSIASYYSPLITAIATVVLAIVTGYYAWLNRKLIKIIEKEIELMGEQLILMIEDKYKKTPALMVSREMKIRKIMEDIKNKK